MDCRARFSSSSSAAAVPESVSSPAVCDVQRVRVLNRDEIPGSVLGSGDVSIKVVAARSAKHWSILCHQSVAWSRVRMGLERRAEVSGTFDDYRA